MNIKSSLMSDDQDARSVDIYAAGMAGLCLLHCIALPVLVSSMSLSLPLIDNEWVHKILVLLAAPATIYILMSDRSNSGRPVFVGAALSGLALLIAGAFVPQLEPLEQSLTIAGSILLASAHLWRARSIRSGQ
ncbi:MAG: MerC domain-containing protein [Pseudomonadota bacterium]